MIDITTKEIARDTGLIEDGVNLTQGKRERVGERVRERLRQTERFCHQVFVSVCVYRCYSVLCVC